MSRKYKNSPIIEALCEFQFEPDPQWDLVMPGLIYDELKDTFPKREHRVVVNAPTDTRAHFPYGEAVNFLREDERAAILVGPNVLSVNHLRPYPNWDQFLPLIKRGLAAYLKVAEPKNLRSVELRYINDIEIAGRNAELGDYFNLRPSIEQSSLQKFAAFITGIQLPYEGSKDTLKIEMQGSYNDENISTLITIDLDYLLAESGNISLANVFDWIDTAHDRIEKAFEACITDKARQMFEEVTE